MKRFIAFLVSIGFFGLLSGCGKDATALSNLVTEPITETVEEISESTDDFLEDGLSDDILTEIVNEEQSSSGYDYYLNYFELKCNCIILAKLNANKELDAVFISRPAKCDQPHDEEYAGLVVNSELPSVSITTDDYAREFTSDGYLGEFVLREGYVEFVPSSNNSPNTSLEVFGTY